MTRLWQKKHRELLWLARQLAPHRRLYGAQISLVFLSSFMGLIDPLILKWLIDDVLVWQRTEMLLLVTGCFFLSLLLNYTLIGINQVIDSYAGQRIVLAIRLQLLEKIQKQTSAFFLRTPTGQLIHRIEQDVAQIAQVGGHSIAALLRILIMTSLTFVVLATMNSRLVWVVLPLVPIIVLLRFYGQPRLRLASDRAQEAQGERVAFLEDHLGTLPQIQLLDRTVAERRRFFKVARSGLRAEVQRRVAELSLIVSAQLTTTLATALVLGFGGWQVIQGSLTVGGLVAFYTYLSRIFGPTQTLVNLYANVQRAKASIRRVLEILDEPPSLVEASRPTPIPNRGPSVVELQDVTFRYRPEEPVLQSLSLKLRAGERVALVGASGCGKSTVARLLTRMADPDDGSIRIDGVALPDIHLRQLRRRVALVPQEPVLFDLSVRENLRLARSDAEDGELMDLLETVQLGDLVDQLPRGLDERLGRRGGAMSGGQRQRLAIARALLCRPGLLILDESTAGLDAVTEYRLLRALDKVIGRRSTVLVIAHRLSAIRWSDRIVLLGEHGEVQGEGDHDTLYRISNHYRWLCEQQLRDGSRCSPAREIVSCG